MSLPELGFSPGEQPQGTPEALTPSKIRRLPGPSRLAKQALHNIQKLEGEVLGTPKIRRITSRHEAFLNGLEKFQFYRALAHLDQGTESDVDLRYVLRNAGKYLGPLEEEEYRERLQRLREGNYTNADAVRVSAHYFSEGNEMGGQVIRRFVHEEKQPIVELSQGLPSGSLDAVDLAILASEEGSSETA